MLTWSLSICKALLLDQAVTNQLPQLIFHRGWGWLDLLLGPHGNKILTLDDRERRLLVHQDFLRLA
jgi:hypothetical protein